MSFCRVFFMKKTPQRRMATAPPLVRNIPKARGHISCYLWILSAHPPAFPPGPYISQVLGNLNWLRFSRLSSQENRHWKRPKGPSLGALINKSCYIHTMKYYEAVKVKTQAMCRAMGKISWIYIVK